LIKMMRTKKISKGFLKKNLLKKRKLTR